MQRVLNVLVLLGVMALAVFAGVSCEMYRTNKLLDEILAAEEVQDQITIAQEYSKPLSQSIQLLALENSEMLEREKAAAAVVGGIQEESIRLKASLKEAVDKLAELNNVNNDLQVEIEMLNEQLRVLKDALKAIQAAQNNNTVVVPDSP